MNINSVLTQFKSEFADKQKVLKYLNRYYQIALLSSLIGSVFAPNPTVRVASAAIYFGTSGVLLSRLGAGYSYERQYFSSELPYVSKESKSVFKNYTIASGMIGTTTTFGICLLIGPIAIPALPLVGVAAYGTFKAESKVFDLYPQRFTRFPQF